MTTPILPPKILLVENDPAAADEIRSALAAAGGGSFDVEWVRQLSDGLTRLNKGGIDAVLLELCLPDSHGIETFDKLFTSAPDARASCLVPFHGCRDLTSRRECTQPRQWRGLLRIH
jgi:CheY-like chemotaxis protein